MQATHYARNAETREQRKQRIEWARDQAVIVLTPKSFEPTVTGELWKGIVDGREVRVSERWKPSQRARQHYTRTTNERKRARQYVAAKYDDRALMATMGSIHAEAN